jgi:hypothetical protein
MGVVESSVEKISLKCEKYDNLLSKEACPRLNNADYSIDNFPSRKYLNPWKSSFTRRVIACMWVYWTVPILPGQTVVVTVNTVSQKRKRRWFVKPC